jgi:2-iminobutanoate/2-iminopropanoate deaminase
MLSSIAAVVTDQAPQPVGHYSQAIRADELIFVSGQLPVALDGSVASDAPFVEQARLAITNVLSIVRAAGSDRDHIVKITAYIVGMANWTAFNRIYAELMDSAKPARTVVPVLELHHGCLVEVDAIAMPVAVKR